MIESGAMPKFSLCENGIDWFKSHGKWQETGGIPSAGSLVFLIGMEMAYRIMWESWKNMKVESFIQ